MKVSRDIRLLLADVDGTLLTHDKVLTPAALSAIAALRDARIAFAITSSRPPYGLRMLMEPLALDTAIAALNGGVYVNPDLSVIREYALDPATAKATVTLFLDQGLDVWLYTAEAWLIRKRDAPHAAREAWVLKTEATIVPAFSDAHLSRAIKIVGVSDDAVRISEAEKAARDAFGAKASIARSQDYFLDVTDARANKGAVLDTISGLLRVAPDHIATIGDGANDVLMFRKSGFSIAMGNAAPEVKAQASAVTDSNENDGFAQAIRNLILQPAGNG